MEEILKAIEEMKKQLNDKMNQIAEDNAIRHNQLTSAVKQTNSEIREVKSEVKKVQADVEFIKDAVKIAYDDIGELQKVITK